MFDAIIDLQSQAIDLIGLFASHSGLLPVTAGDRPFFFIFLNVFLITWPLSRISSFRIICCYSVTYDYKKTLLPFGEQGPRKLCIVFLRGPRPPLFMVIIGIHYLYFPGWQKT